MDTRHYVYLLRCADGSLYTGMTPDIARRLRLRQARKIYAGRLPGCAKYTRSHPVTALALLLTTDTATTARQLEARIKRLTRAQKDALIVDPARLCRPSAPHWPGQDIRPVPDAQLTDSLRRRRHEQNRQTPERLPVLLCLWFSADRAAPDSGARAWQRR